jgi:hypothetical protein
VPATSPCAIDLRAKRIRPLAAATVEQLQPSSLSDCACRLFVLRVGVEVGHTVRLSVATCTEGDQVLFGIVAGMTAKFFMVDFQVRHCTARLTAPAVAAQNLLP